MHNMFINFFNKMSDSKRNQKNQAEQPYNIPYLNPYFPYFSMGPMGALGPYTGYPMAPGYPFMPHPHPHPKPQEAHEEPPKMLPKKLIKQKLNGGVKAPEVAQNNQDQAKLGSSQSQSCHCIKSHCLKQYCLCFKRGVACEKKCSCSGCKNTEDELNEKLKPKLNKKLKCKCHKSQCIKKYCQCFSAKKKCEENCLCISCEN